MKIFGRPMDLDFDVEDVAQAVQAATTQDKARIARALIHDLTFRRDMGERTSFLQALGPTDAILWRDLIDPPKAGGHVEKA